MRARSSTSGLMLQLGMFNCHDGVIVIIIDYPFTLLLIILVQARCGRV